MKMTDKPTVQQIFEEELKQVYSEADPSWRHGCYMMDVYLREEDDTYWSVNYQLSGDGEYNTLRDDPQFVEFIQVWPRAVTVTEYTTNKPEQCK